MAFTFLHTADWQLGKAFGGFEPETAAILREARIAAVDRLAAACLAAGGAHIVVCGDVFDNPAAPDRFLRSVVARLSGHARLTWHLLPGNHDPDRPDGVWQRLVDLGLPANVKLLRACEPVRVTDDVVLLPAPLASKAVTADPTGWMDACPTPGRIRIGVAHGSIRGFGSDRTASVGIDPGRRRSAALDYLALGDWHGTQEISAGVWYSGTPEPDQFPDNDPGHALVVSIDAPGAAPRVAPVATAQFEWCKRLVEVERGDEIDDLVADVDRRGAGRSALLLQVALRGSVSADVDASIDQRLDELRPMLRYLAVDRGALRVTAADDAGKALRDPVLAAVASRLEAARAAGDEVAGGALRRLYKLARQAEARRP